MNDWFEERVSRFMLIFACFAMVIGVAAACMIFWTLFCGR